MDDALTAMYINRYIPFQIREDVQLIYNDVHSTALKLIHKAEWVHGFIKQFVIQQIKNITTKILFDDVFYDDTWIEEKYANVIKLI